MHAGACLTDDLLITITHQPSHTLIVPHSGSTPTVTIVQLTQPTRPSPPPGAGPASRPHQALQVRTPLPRLAASTRCPASASSLQQVVVVQLVVVRQHLALDLGDVHPGHKVLHATRDVVGRVGDGVGAHAHVALQGRAHTGNTCSEITVNGWRGQHVRNMRPHPDHQVHAANYQGRAGMLAIPACNPGPWAVG